MTGPSLEIQCPACGREALLLRRPIYEGFTKTGESLTCASCGHAFASESEVPFKHRARIVVFREDERPRTPKVFAEGENQRLCRYCCHYVVNPFLQRCGLQRREVEATDTCGSFVAKPPPEVQSGVQPVKRLLAVAVSLGLCLATGCRTPQPSPWAETLTQVSSFSALQAGSFDGFFAVSNLVLRGDMGLGTFQDLNGELVMVSGVVYQACADGMVRRPGPTELVPFAQVTWFEAETAYAVMDLSRAVFEKSLLWKNPGVDRPLAIRVHGYFRRIKVRSVAAVAAPHPTLAQALSTGQQVWEKVGIAGTLVGFHFPSRLKGPALDGFHLHFISDDRQLAGHVLDFHLGSGRIELDDTPVWCIALPEDAVRLKDLQSMSRSVPR